MPDHRKRSWRILQALMTLSGLVAIALGLLALPPAGAAQQAGKVPRLGFLSATSAISVSARVETFRAGLRELGYVEGQNLIIEWRWAEGRDDRLPEFAEELVRLKVDVIVTHGILATRAAGRATAKIPIVIASADDPVAAGLVSGLARPGGNITGLSIMGPELTGKRLELLREMFPRMRRLAVLRNPTNPVSVPELKETQAAAASLGLQIRPLEATEPGGIAGAFSAMTRERADALIVLSDAMLTGQRVQIVRLAANSRLPAIYSTREFPEAGGLMSYGPNLPDLWRRSATYVDKILKGTKPADLPVEQPMRFDLVLNMKTAKALSLKIPQTIHLRGPELIQ